MISLVLVYALFCIPFQEEIIPEKSIRTNTGLTVWLPVSEINTLNKNGEDPFEGHFGNVVKGYIEEGSKLSNKTNNSGCNGHVVGNFHETFLPHANYIDLINNSKFIFGFKVTSLEPGFYMGFPSHLITLEIRSSWKGNLSEEKTMHLVYPGESIKVFDINLCSDSGFKYVPNAESEGVLFLYPDSVDQSTGLVKIMPEMIFFKGPSGNLVKPQSLILDQELRSINTFQDFKRLIMKQYPKHEIPRKEEQE